MTAIAAAHTPHVSRRALIVVGVLAAAALAATTSGAVQLPDLDKALTDLSDRLGTWTYLLVAGLAFLETGAFVGLIAPGETAVILGGVVAARHQVDLPVMLAVAWVAAASGDLVSFALGGRLGRRFLQQRGPRLGVTAPRLARVEQFFDKHGPKAILAGRFVGLVRAVAPFLAGASGMRLRAFLPWSLLGTAAWSATFVLVGYAFSSSFGTAAGLITHGALALAVAGVAALLLRSRLQARRLSRRPG
jgi:membrane protein DedA with SNARE-associated domain